jgi:hypothetical protein
MAIGDVQVAMQPGHFNSIIRQIKTSPFGVVEQFGLFAKEAMRRLRLKPDASKAVSGVPDGSDQTDIQSFAAWTRKIVKRDRDSKRQLVKIHATIVTRVGG